MESPFYVEIVQFEGGVVVKRIGCVSERAADRVDNGLNINLNYEEYYTRIIDRNNPPEGWTEAPIA